MKTQLPDLPITPYLDEICNALKNSPSRFLVVTAQTAAGKSTAIPLALLQHQELFPGSILMLEPRRLAVLAIANRVSSLIGEPVGNTVGYQMHLESAVSKNTRITILTEAILTRKLQQDAALEGVSVVIIDEFHERSIHADLALAFLKEIVALRDDLYVIVMSATIDTTQIAAYLGSTTPAPVLSIPGRQYPVLIIYDTKHTPAQAVIQELQHPHHIEKQKPSTILVFLPGISVISHTKHELEEYLQLHKLQADILILHSSIPFADQKKVLIPPSPDSPRRVILSSSIAETSITVPDITVVIDSGLSRFNRINLRLGMETLVTENESVFSAQQRTGRAGRTGPGFCIRLWNEHDVRTTSAPPEILRTDITQLVLECAQWGVTSASQLSWLDQPSENAWKTAQNLLQQLECIYPNEHATPCSITPKGKATLLLGLHPRLASTAFYDIHAALQYSSYKDSNPALQNKWINDINKRLQKCSSFYHLPSDTTYTKEEALLSGFPDRLAHLCDVTKAIYQFYSGRLATLPKQESQSQLPQWIIAPEVDAGEQQGYIYNYTAIDTHFCTQWLSKHTSEHIKTEFIENTYKIRKIKQQCYGKIVLSEQKIPVLPSDTISAICEMVKEKGISWLPLSKKTQLFLLRAELYQHEHKDTITADSVYLSQTVAEWLTPFLSGDTVLDEQIVFNALYWYLDGTTIDKNVPIKLTMPNGKSYPLLYEKHTDTSTGVSYIQPVLEIIIQRIFGCFTTPRIMNIPVLFKLLSPASRPLQVTDDLEGFWQNTWPQICKEMKGRYPKHNWNYKVIQSE
ncbi:MAG: DEAD/DEAH box helicase [Treponema sp.]|nr:DEAD/DEAH box helicase [Treponema sp.]